MTPFGRLGPGSCPRRLSHPALAAAAALVWCAAARTQMVDPAIDGLAGPFTYLAKPSTVLGGIGAQGATQVTWDGALYTGYAELLLVTGDPPQPVSARAKLLGGGRLPVVHTSWLQRETRFSATAFAVALSEGGLPANVLRLRIERLGEDTAPASIGFGLRYSGLDRRAPALQRFSFDPTTRYEWSRNAALMNGRAVCVVPGAAPDRQYAVAGESYSKAFAGTEHGVGPSTGVLLGLWDLGAKRELAADVVMPWEPLPPEDTRTLDLLRRMSCDEYANQVAQSWEVELSRGLQILLPEAKPREAFGANLTYLLMATEVPAAGSPRFHDHLAGAELTPAESIAAAHALDLTGRHDLARSALSRWLDAARADGCLSAAGDVAEHCDALAALISHAWLTGDLPWAQSAADKLHAAGDWLVTWLAGTEAQPPALLQAAEALGAAAEFSTLVGRPDEAATLRAQTRSAVARAEAALTGSPLPVEALATLLSANRGLPDSPPPSFLDPHAEHTTELCRRVHLAYAEGVATEEGTLSPGLTLRMARLHALRGESEQALLDLYGALVHTGACHEGFTRGGRPWSDRDCGEAWTPDPRFSAAYLQALRDLLIREQREELHLFSGMSPAWLKRGQLVGVSNAPTSFGLVTAALQAETGGATILLAADWHAAPSRVIVHLPYFADVTSVDADRPGLHQAEGPPPAAYEAVDLPVAGSGSRTQWLEVRPDTTRISIRWTLDPEAQLSYEASVDRWRDAYAARYRQFIADGGQPTVIAPLRLR